jgi:hypothetical protein
MDLALPRQTSCLADKRGPFGAATNAAELDRYCGAKHEGDERVFLRAIVDRNTSYVDPCSHSTYA